jgi:hypothetical protein
MLAYVEQQEGCMQRIELQLGGDLSDGLIAATSLRLARDLEREGMPAHLPVPEAAPHGARGTTGSLGRLVLDAVSGKLLVTALETLKGYLIRDRSLKVTLTLPDGRKVEIDSKNVDSAEVKHFVDVAKAALG